MMEKKHILDDMIKHGFSTQGRTYFYYLERYSIEELREIYKKYYKKG